MTASETNPTGDLRDRKVNERVDGTRYPTTTKVLAFEQDLETKLNLSRNPCGLGHEIYRDSQRRFLPPRMWHAADRMYAQRFGGLGGGVRRLQDMDPYGRLDYHTGHGGITRQSITASGSCSRTAHGPDDDYLYGIGMGTDEGFTMLRVKDFDPVAFNESDMGWDGFRGSFAALTKLFWSPQVREAIAPEKTKMDAFLFHQRWFDLVKVYSAGKLTFQKDKLMAVSSIVREIRARHSGNRYVDGLWEETLLMDLLWRVDVKSLELLGMGREGDNGLPSWTWASMDCRVADGLEGDEHWVDDIVEMATVVEVTPSNTIEGSRHGRSAGILKLRGVVVKHKIAESDGRYIIKNDDGEDIGEMYPDFNLDVTQGSVECIGILEVRGRVKGLVLSATSDGQGEIVYSRCGFFSTDSKKDALLGASFAGQGVPMVEVRIV